MNTKNAMNLNSMAKWLAMAGLVAGLSACGGGSSSSSQMNVNGTAATGKALDGATVTANCASGTGTATANASGSYTVTIENGQGPCVLTATKNGVTLRSITPGAGVANITPLTDILVTYLAGRAGTTPDALLSTNNGKAIIGDSKAINDGQTAVVNYLQTTYGVTITSPNFLTVSITPPASGSTQGNAADSDLEGLLNKVIDTTGSPMPAVKTAVTTVAKTTPYVAPTGGTGTSN